MSLRIGKTPKHRLKQKKKEKRWSRMKRTSFVLMISLFLSPAVKIRRRIARRMKREKTISRIRKFTPNYR